MSLNKQKQSEDLNKKVKNLEIEISLLRDAYFQLEKTKKKLKQSEEAHRLLAENTRDLIWTTDLKGNLTYISHAVKILLGYNKKKILGMSYFKLMTKDSFKKAIKIKQLFSDPKKQFVSLELDYIHKNGKIIPFDVLISIVRDETGKPLVIQGTSRDITEKKKAEEILKQYQFVIEQSTQQISFADLKGTITYVNHAWARGHGYTKEETIGKNLAIFHTKEEMINVNRFNTILIKKGQHAGEIIHKRKDGTTYQTFMNNFVLKMGNKPIYLVAMATDITEEKKAEEALRESEEKYRDLFYNVPVGFHVFGSDKKIIDINKAELEMFGYKREEIINKKTWEDLVVPEDDKKFKKHWKCILNNEVINDFEYSIVRKDGQKINVILSASARFDDKGKLINTRGSVVDITERKKAEEKLKKKTDDLQRLNRAMIGRESKMIELKEEIKKFKRRKNEN